MVEGRCRNVLRHEEMYYVSTLSSCGCPFYCGYSFKVMSMDPPTVDRWGGVAIAGKAAVKFVS